MPSLPTIVGISVTSMIGCYLVFPTATKSFYDKFIAETDERGKKHTLVAPEKFGQRCTTLAKQVTSPCEQVAFYRDVGLFGAAVYLISTQGHQLTVMN